MKKLVSFKNGNFAKEISREKMVVIKGGKIMMNDYTRTKCEANTDPKGTTYVCSDSDADGTPC